MSFKQKFQQNVSLAPYTTFHIGGSADYFIKVSSIDALCEAIQYAKENHIAFFILGQGANILIGDKGFRGLVIKNEARNVWIEKQTVTAESGVTIEALINKTSDIGLSGLEHFAGIPSSLGGAVWQNLHFLSADRSTTIFIGDRVESARILDEDGEVKEVFKDYFHFDYDYSILHTAKAVVLSVNVVLQKEKKETIQETIKKNLAWRKEKHPENAVHTSAGSVFKKIAHHGAGRLIEQVGLKGKKIGGAQISPKHANFIINTGNATAKDVRDVIALAQTEVKKATGLQLDPEISFIGEF